MVDVPAGFMLDPGLYQVGADLGVPGMGIYVAGRAGVLGPVHADVVAAVFVVFNPEVVRSAWESALAAIPPREAAAAFAGFGADWAALHLGDGPDHVRLAELCGRVCDGTDARMAPLFAAWRAATDLAPDEPKALALHRLNLLRELRGALHGAALLTVGLEPIEAVMVRSPFLAPIYGWPEPHPEGAAFEEQWQQAEELTDQMAARAFSVLDDRERDELAALCTAVCDSMR